MDTEMEALGESVDLLREHKKAVSEHWRKRRRKSEPHF